MADSIWNEKMLALFSVLGIDERMVERLDVESGSEGVTIKISYLEQYKEAVRRG